jgi:ADP-ribosylglycohydrolase
MPEEAIDLAAESSRTTHGAPEAMDACRYYAGLLVGALGGESKAILLGTRYHPGRGGWGHGELSARVDEVAGGSFRAKSPSEIRGTGYVVRSLEAALWAFDASESFQEGALLAVNLGEDADTTGAIYGQLAGAYYGASGIPAHWLGKLTLRKSITDTADRLLEFAGRTG